MKKTIRIILIAVCSISLLILCLFIWHKYQVHLLKEEQIALGKNLGVNAENYSKDFPIDYFHSKLTPYMSINDVHKLIVGYDKVFRCSEINEFYLYFSNDPDKAIHFSIMYQNWNDLRFDHMEFTDQNSGYPDIDDCKEGLLPGTN